MARYVEPARLTKYDALSHPMPVKKSGDEWDAFPQRVKGHDGWWRRICGHCHRFPRLDEKKWWRSSKPFGKMPVSLENSLAGTNLSLEWHYDRNGSVLLPMQGTDELYWWGGLQPEHVSKGSHVRVWWHCPKGHSYDATVHSRAIRNSRCPLCTMKGPESKFYDWLKTQNVKFQYNFTLPGLKSKCNKALYFDFWLPECNTVVELDGPHHRRPMIFGHEERDANERFLRQMENDGIKDEYCKIHLITMIRIALERNSTFKLPFCIATLLQES